MTTVKMVKLGTLIKPAKLQKCGNDDYPVLSMTMHNGLVFQSDKFKKSVASQDKSTYKVVHRNQLVTGFPIDEGVLATQRITDVGIVSPAYGIWDVDQTKIIPEFLEYALRCNRAIDYYKAKLRGSTARRRSLPTPTLLELDVPLPDIEQQRLALATIHHAKNALDSRQAQLTKLDELVKARFVEMFGNAETTSQAQTKRLEECCISISGGNTPSMQHPEYYGGKIPFIKSGDVKSDHISVSSLTLTQIALNETTVKMLPKGTLIVVIRSAALLKEFRIGILDVDAVINQDLKALQTSDDVLPVYLMWAIKMKSQVLLSRVQTMLTSHIRMEDLLDLKVQIPHLSLQNQFANFVAEINKSKVEVQKALDQTQLLFDSLMQQYFG